MKMKLNTYLVFDGDCEEAFKFYEQILGGKIEAMVSSVGTPMEQQVPPERRNKILNGRLILGDGILLGMDAPPEHYQQPKGFFVTLQIDDPAQAERLFHALEDGGKVEMPIQQTFWATRFGMLVDRFGIPWMINCLRAAERAA
jgi:PhnB protein